MTSLIVHLPVPSAPTCLAKANERSHSHVSEQQRQARRTCSALYAPGPGVVADVVVFSIRTRSAVVWKGAGDGLITPGTTPVGTSELYVPGPMFCVP
jgi:hypothetical protein